jgi:glutamyl/glutaminyl-tRNA synthetase
MKQGRMDGIESKYRNNSVEENLRLWDEMQRGTEEGKKCLMRAKIDMQSLNKCLRDPGLYRVVADTPHHRTGYVASSFQSLVDLALIQVTHCHLSGSHTLTMYVCT